MKGISTPYRAKGCSLLPSLPRSSMWHKSDAWNFENLAEEGN